MPLELIPATDSLTDVVVASITGVVSLLAILISLINANGSASRAAFAELKSVVDAMKVELTQTRDELRETKRELNKERRARIRYEQWARTLDKLLTQHDIKHPDLDDIDPEREEEKD